MAGLREVVKVSRRVPLDPIALRVALLFLALDTLSDSRRWTLGPLGAIELHPPEFAAGGAEARNGARRSSTSARLCAPDGYCVDAQIVLATRDGADPLLTLRTGPICDAHHDELVIAARAGLRELTEELLFFGTRQPAMS